MLLPELVQHVSGVHTTVLGQSPWDGLKSLGKVVDDELGLALNGLEVFSEISRKLHFNGSASSNDCMRLDGSSDDHDGIVQRSLSLLEVLGSAASKHKGGGLGLSAISEHVVAVVSKLDFLELSTSAENLFSQALNSGLEDSTSGLGDTGQVSLVHSTSAEDVVISKSLSSQVSDGKTGQHNLGARSNHLVQLFVDNVPLGIHYLLEVLWIVDTNLSIVLLSLELKLHIQDGDLGVVEELWSLFETSIREGLSEADTLNEEGLGD